MMCYASIPMVMVTALDDDDPVAMVPAAMPAKVAMLAHFGAGAVAMVVAVLDHHRFGIRHRRCNDRERGAATT